MAGLLLLLNSLEFFKDFVLFCAAVRSCGSLSAGCACNEIENCALLGYYAVEISYRYFRTTYRCHLQGSRKIGTNFIFV